MTATESLFELLTPYGIGDASTDKLTSTNFTLLVTRFTTRATNDGLTGDDADEGVCYLIADIIETKEGNADKISEKIGDYAYQKATGTLEASGTSWLAKYDRLLKRIAVKQPQTAVVRSDADMSALGMDQAAIPKLYNTTTYDNTGGSSF